jgi:hypothetical protein
MAEPQSKKLADPLAALPSAKEVMEQIARTSYLGKDTHRFAQGALRLLGKEASNWGSLQNQSGISLERPRNRPHVWLARL